MQRRLQIEPDNFSASQKYAHNRILEVVQNHFGTFIVVMVMLAFNQKYEQDEHGYVTRTSRQKNVFERNLEATLKCMNSIENQPCRG